jgi:tetratricopeptide (TPR) repeat protein
MRRLGDYEVLDEIGRGATGAVYRARSSDGRVVAIKLLTARDEAKLQRFERERRLLASLDEAAGFVPLLDAGASPQGPYLVMPLAEGGTLARRLGAGPLGVAESVALVRELATAIGRAHALGIVHRDLKPENVLFTAEGRPLVADVGLAKHFLADAPGASQSVSITREGTVLGTALYMAPEQTNGASDAGPPADVFSLGAILYECLAGRPAFAAATILQVFARIESGAWDPLPGVRPETPSWLVAVVDRALSADPAVRPRDGAALAAALAGAAPGRAKRGAVLALAGGALAVAAVATTLAIWLPARRLGLARERLAAARSELAGGRPDPALADATLAVELAPALAPAWLARAEAKRALADDRGAIEDATRALALDPTAAPAWRCRGIARTRAGDAKQALADLDRSLASDRSDVEARLAHGTAEQSTGDLDAAVADFEAAVALDRKNKLAAAKLAHVLAARLLARSARLEVHATDLVPVIAALTRAIELDPKQPLCFLERGLLRSGGSAHEEAVQDFTAAIELDPGLAKAWAERGLERLLLHETAGALEDCRHATELDPGLARAWFCLAYVKATAKDHAGAIADFGRALALEPENAAFLAARGLERALADEPRAGLSDCDRAVALMPKEPSVYAKRALVRQALGDVAGAIQDLERAVELDPEAASAGTIRGEIARLKGLERK